MTYQSNHFDLTHLSTHLSVIDTHPQPQPQPQPQPHVLSKHPFLSFLPFRIKSIDSIRQSTSASVSSTDPSVSLSHSFNSHPLNAQSFNSQSFNSHPLHSQSVNAHPLNNFSRQDKDHHFMTLDRDPHYHNSYQQHNSNQQQQQQHCHHHLPTTSANNTSDFELQLQSPLSSLPPSVISSLSNHTCADTSSYTHPLTHILSHTSFYTHPLSDSPPLLMPPPPCLLTHTHTLSQVSSSLSNDAVTASHIH